ncbi:Non-homologous end joining protein Ku [Nitrospira japonica]|uniref:Non-homologous end joining protein Ku n=1 Tax=Nitrospira japonica TaxID=1325564 RepID=A0A1W1I2X4_9BACT|nr:Non-homologous end joining protein Ku [Nitrospira japonica]
MPRTRRNRAGAHRPAHPDGTADHTDNEASASRVLWKGAISFGLVHIPVGLYSAENRSSFDLTMLDRRSMHPVGFKRYNKDSGEDVPWNDIVKGYEYEKGRYVVLTDEDFRRANIEATQTVEIVNFVPQEAISPLYFDTPYYLAPDKRGEKGYVLLRETLKQTGKVAIANVVIRTRQHVAALLPVGSVIVMNTLRYPNELRPSDELDIPSGNLKAVGVNAREIDMARRLVDEMSEDWKPETYRDTYHGDLLALIEKRVQAGQTEAVEQPAVEEEQPSPKGEVIDLMALLKRSVETRGKSGKPAGPSGSRGRKAGRSAA